MYTNEAGTWPEISGLSGKIGKGRRSLSEKFGSAAMLHVTVPLSNVRFRPRGAGRALQTADCTPPIVLSLSRPARPLYIQLFRHRNAALAWGSVQAEV
jgi:hypothetical protein